MQLLILAAGYATRLYPLTLNQPKPLLPVAGRPMINHVLDHLSGIGGIERVLVVTNHKFITHFEEWAARYDKKGASYDFKIIDDGSTSDDDKLGAIGDIHLVIEREQIKGDLMVVAGDNLFDQSLADFGRACAEKKGPVLGVYDVKDWELVKKYNSISVDSAGQITHFEEKSAEPKSTLTGIALYYYPEAVIPLIKQYIAEGNNPDQPGRLVQWLYPRLPFYTWEVPGTWFDIGGKKSLAEADALFSQKLS
ncbi:MAG: nucleotidyltransferase family protein [Blastochloris sp.]|jgi:glucose-1-phosphate thymidylyltransferase|nr:nucleotidyltransferase family protein [Blastochloris sp.]